MREREVPRAWPLSQALLTAKAILSGEVGVLEGCIRLSGLSRDIVADWRVDPDFRLFGAVASDIDHLPFGDVRARWSASALVRADAEIQRITEHIGPKVREACEHLLSRFTGVETFP